MFLCLESVILLVQMKLLHDSLDKRISALEKLKEAEVPQQQHQQVEATE